MKNQLKILLLFFTLISFKGQTKIKCESNIETAKMIQETPLTVSQHTESIAEQWNYMVFEKGGCLGGTQYISEKKREIPTMVFSEKEWKQFAKNEKTALTEFLITKLSDTAKTKVHTCPFFSTTHEEMAIYALQHIHGKNWYDFSEFNDSKYKVFKSATEQPQIWLQHVLNNKTKRSALAQLYRDELKN
ncbi:conserved hypothetical protein [Tenacibaculum litopenaei]|uniref:hypothetical protein n=1 Tax=Tenacibaculum litopenaei TaxID=396016 RepID=UPI0038939A21